MLPASTYWADILEGSRRLRGRAVLARWLASMWPPCGKADALRELEVRWFLVVADVVEANGTGEIQRGTVDVAVEAPAAVPAPEPPKQ